MGIYTITSSILLVFLTAISSGIPLTISKITAENNNNKLTSKYITAGLIISTIFSVLICLSLIVFKPIYNYFLNNNVAYILLLFSIPTIILTGLQIPFYGYFWGKQNYFVLSLIELIEQVVRISICIIGILTLSKYYRIYTFIISLSFAYATTTIIYIVLYFKNKLKLIKPTTKNIKHILKHSTPITSIRIINSIIQPLIAIILPIQLINYGLTNEQAISQLGVAMGITFPILSIPSTIITALAMALLPQISALQKEKNNIKLKSKINFAINFSIICSVFIIPIFYSLGIPICNMIFNSYNAGFYLKYATLILVPLSLSQITTTILNSLNMEKTTFIHCLISNSTLLLCIFILPKFIGINSLIYAFGLESLLLSYLNIKKIKTTLNIHTSILKTILKTSLIIIPLNFLTKWIYSILIYMFPEFISISLAGVIEVIFFILLSISLNIIKIEKFKLKNIKS